MNLRSLDYGGKLAGTGDSGHLDHLTSPHVRGFLAGNKDSARGILHKEVAERRIGVSDYTAHVNRETVGSFRRREQL